jgi:FtsP/CotA-like multicopper oxidase with cupredoxin domain
VVPLTAIRLAGLTLCLGVVAAAVTPPRAGDASAEPTSSVDFSDARYLGNGVDPAKILGRVERISNECSGTRRAPEIRGGYDAAGCPVYFHRFGSLQREGYALGPGGKAAAAVGDRFRVFIFPRRQGRPQSTALSELRQDPLFDTTPGYLRHNPLGLWRLTFVRYAPSAFSSSEGIRLLEELRKRNDTDLDGTPLLKHVSEVRELAGRGFVVLDQRPDDGAQGPPWVIWRLIADPRREGIPADATLMLVARVDGVPADREIEQHFLSLSEAGAHCIAPMPRLPAFVQALPLPARLPAGKLVELHERSFVHRFHPDLPPSTLWGYEGELPGPTLTLRRGEPVVVRCWDQLPVDENGGFGRPWTACRFRVPAGPAGFPLQVSAPGQFKSHDLSPSQAGTGCYGDGMPGFSAQNTYKGLAGLLVVQDSFDSGDENDSNAGASRLPSGSFDVPLLLSDRQFDVTLDHALSFDAFEIDGPPGDYSTVNGAVQPYFRVARRKYRFRLLNVGPSRFYELALGSGQAFVQIGGEGGLLEAPRRRSELRLAPGGQLDVVVDFSEVALGSEVFLENRQPQESGRGPVDRPLTPQPDGRVLKFMVDRDAPDPSRIPKQSNGSPAGISEAALPTRTFVLENRRGAWTVNGNYYEFDRVDARVKRGASEIWILKNASKDWTHPMPGAAGELGPGSEVRLPVRFGEQPGRYVLPCGNATHADLGLMIQWDVEP